MCTSTWPNSACENVKVDGPGVVHVERDGLAVGHHQAGVADGPSAGARNAMIITSRSPLGPLTRCLTESVVSKNRWNPSFSSSRRRSGTGIVRQQHDGVLVDVRAQVLRVEVVLVQVGDVEVVAVAERVPVQPAVVGEREPGREVRRVDPGVAQDASGLGVDPEAGVADAGDLHKYPFW